MPDRIALRLTFTSPSVSPEQFTQRLGLEPARYWHRAKPDPRTRRLAHFDNGWVYEPKVEPDAPLDEHVSALLDAVMPHREAFAQAARETRPLLTLAVASPEPRHSLFLHEPLIRLAAELNAEIELDFRKSDE